MDLDAFAEPEPLLSVCCDSDIEVYPVLGLQAAGQAVYQGEDFGWFYPSQRRARLLRVRPGAECPREIWRQLQRNGMGLQPLLEKLKLSPREAVFIETGEKEFSVEICHISDQGPRILRRYTLDSPDQGDRLGGVSNFQIL